LVFKKREKHSPRFIGAGFQKCGSSSLHQFLVRNVPWFCNPRYSEKELHAVPSKREASPGDHREYLKKLGPTVPGFREPLDFTPNYAHRLSTLANIHKMFPGVRLFLTVRDPVERFYSALDHGKQMGVISAEMSDRKAFSLAQQSNQPWVGGLLEHGLYVPAIRASYQLFGPENVFVTSLSKLTSPSQGASEIHRLAEFVGWHGLAVGKKTFPHVNESGIRSRPQPMIPRTARSEDVVAALRDFYEPWQEELASLVGAQPVTEAL
jgi:hypothetical protein